MITYFIIAYFIFFIIFFFSIGQESVLAEWLSLMSCVCSLLVAVAVTIGLFWGWL